MADDKNKIKDTTHDMQEALRKDALQTGEDVKAAKNKMKGGIEDFFAKWDTESK